MCHGLWVLYLPLEACIPCVDFAANSLPEQLLLLLPIDCVRVWRARAQAPVDDIPIASPELLSELGSAQIELLPVMYTNNQMPMHHWRPRWHHLAQHRVIIPPYPSPKVD